MFRHKQDDAQAAPTTVYQMRQQMFAIGDDYWIENGAGQRVFKVDGKALRVRKTLILETPNGLELFKIQDKLATVRDTMEIEGPAGRVATVHKKLISPLRERYNVEFDAGGEWAVEGNIADHQYEMKADDVTVAEVGKKWFRVRDTYGIEVGPDQNAGLVIAVAIVVDAMANPAK
jgi:uncharacterized protein YxjI